MTHVILNLRLFIHIYQKFQSSIIDFPLAVGFLALLVNTNEKLQSQSLVEPILRAICYHAEEVPDESSRAAAVDALSALSSLSLNLLALIIQRREVVESWMAPLTGRPQEQAAVLLTVARVVNALGDSLSESNASSDLLFTLVNHIGEKKRSDTLEFLIKAARIPVTEVKHAAYALLSAVARFGGGRALQWMLESEHFMLLISDTSTENSKEGMEWKFELIVQLRQNPKYALLAEAVRNRIDHLHSFGPYRPETTRMAELVTERL